MNTQQSNGTSNQTALESEPASDEGQEPHQLACMEVWGGTRQVRLEVRLSGLAAWVCSMPIESSTGGGDVHYLSVCNAGLVSRIALADVSGHGPEVNTVAQLLLRLMHRYINDWDQSDFMRDLDRDFPGDRLGSPYATAVLLSFYREVSRLAFTNAGHYPPLWFQANEKRWGLLREAPIPADAEPSGLPLGLVRETDYRQTATPTSR